MQPLPVVQVAKLSGHLHSHSAGARGKAAAALAAAVAAAACTRGSQFPGAAQTVCSPPICFSASKAPPGHDAMLSRSQQGLAGRAQQSGQPTAMNCNPHQTQPASPLDQCSPALCTTVNSRKKPRGRSGGSRCGPHSVRPTDSFAADETRMNGVLQKRRQEGV